MTISWLAAFVYAATLFFPPSVFSQRAAPPQPQPSDLSARALAGLALIEAGVPMGNTLTAEGTFVLQSPVFAYRLSKNATLLDGWSQALGLSLTEVDEPLRAHLRLTANEGLLVTGVTANGVAERAKLQTHDVILGLPVTVQVERPLELVAVRAGQRVSLVVDATPAKQYWIGVHTADVDDAMRTQLSLPAGRGVLISEVIDKSPAQKAGLVKHDVVSGLADGTAVAAPGDLSKIVQASAGNVLQLQIVRHAKSITISVTPTERPKEQNVNVEAGSNLQWALTGLANQVAPNYVYTTREGQLTVQPTWIQTIQPTLVQAATPDPASKVEALQKQVEQLLKEVTSLRQALEKKPQTGAETPKK